MDSYFAGHNVTVTVPLIAGGVAVSDPDEASYRVLDANGYLVTEGQVLDITDAGAEIVVLADFNTLSFTEKRGYRSIEVTFRVDENSHLATADYLLESVDLLEAGVNSFQTFGEAVLTAADMTDVKAFMNADRSGKIQGLVNAYNNLTTMRFAVDRCRQNLDLGQLTGPELLDLPAQFLRRLRQAQVIEASEAMTSFSIHRKRQMGLMSETIGESSMMFRPEKVLLIPVTRRTLELLSNYLSWEVSIGRG